MIKSNVTPSSKAKSIPHPKVGSGYPAGVYNDPNKKGKDISFIPKKVNTMTYQPKAVKKN